MIRRFAKLLLIILIVSTCLLVAPAMLAQSGKEIPREWTDPDTGHRIYRLTDEPNSTSDEETPAGDPELAALVRPHAPPDDSDPSTRDGDPELAALVRHNEPPFDADTALFPVAAVTEDEPPARPRRRGSLALRFGVSFALGLLLAVGVGAGALYAWGQQYEGLVLPGVRIGSTELGGLTREQAAAAIQHELGGLGTGEIALTGPDGPTP